MNKELFKKILYVVFPYLLLTTPLFIYAYINIVPTYYENFDMDIAIQLEQNVKNAIFINMFIVSFVLIVNYNLYKSLNLFISFYKN